MQRKLNIFVKKFDNVRFFSKWRIKASKEVNTIISLGMWRDTVMPEGRLAVLSTLVTGA